MRSSINPFDMDKLYLDFIDKKNDENYVEIHNHLDRSYSSKSISMIKTRAIAKVQAKIVEMGGLATIRPL